MFTFGRLAAIEFQRAVVYQISSKSDLFSFRYGDLTICNIVDIGHLEFFEI